MGKRRGQGTSKAWGIGGVALFGAATLTLSGFALNATNTAPESTAAPAPIASFQSTGARIQVATVGDSYTAGSGEDSGDFAEWPSALTRQLDIRIQNLGVGSIGYVQSNDKQQTLVTQSALIASDTKAVVFMGSRNDQNAAPSQIQAAAAEAFGNALRTIPAEKILVVGPAWPNAQPPRGILAARDAVAAAASETGVNFVDPSAQGWLADTPDLIGSDGIHPNDAGHAYLAEKLSPLVQQIVEE